MNERARPRPRETLRCPFCHDALGDVEDQRVECGDCQATHHAPCFAEHGGCAGMGCAGRTAWWGDRPLTARELSYALQDPAPPTPRRVPWAALGLLCLLAAPATTSLALVSRALLLTGIALLTAAALTARRPRPRRLHVSAPSNASFDPIFGGWSDGAWVPGDNVPRAGADLLRKLSQDDPPLPPDPDLRLPDRCPDCDTALEQDPDAAPFPFCYHCGADLRDD